MPALELFYSYSHKDELLCNKLKTHLALLEREGLIQPWHDRCIRPGSEWANQIDDHIRSAAIILLLISPDFLASKYCFDIEMRLALERHEKKEAQVIPVILHEVDWHTSPFGKLQSLPRDGKPVTDFRNRNKAFAAIAKELRTLVTQTQTPAQPNPADAAARDKYLSWVATQHRYIRFSGMAVVDERAEVDMAKVFVLPRLLPQSHGAAAGEEKSAGLPVHQILANPNTPNRLMILGGPGSGKTTLLESLALAFARPATFSWSQRLPNLLPVFYRIRDLDKDLQEHSGSVIWDCLNHHCCRGMQNENALPAGFFQRQMHAPAGGLAILFDGLDEAGSLARRNEIVKLIDAFAAQLPAHCRLIVTSRPHDYRNRFDESAWQHLSLAEFDDSEIQTFIANWQKIHQPDRLPGKDLWNALESRSDILPLARNALLLTMIVRVHFGLGALPDSRLGLYEKCTETLLKHWAEAKGLDDSPIDTSQKRKLLQRLAFEMQGEVEKLDPDLTLQISRSDLVRRFTAYLKEDGGPHQQVDKVIDRLHARDAILVQYSTDKTGQDQFGFVHRSFQEYFAAGWLANEIPEDEFRAQLLAPRDGWNETLCLAVGQLRPDMRRRKTLLDLLMRSQVSFAVECLKAAAAEQPWLRLLVQFLSKYTRVGREFRDLPAAECAAACAGRPETMQVLQAMFHRDNRQGEALAAAVDLAEELARSGNSAAQALLRQFFAEAHHWPEDMLPVAAGPFPFGSENEMTPVPAFLIDRYPVTNEEYERMVPAHREERDQYSDADKQPVIYVSWFEAQLYARWRGCRLPSEQEWEKAASWDVKNQKKRVYPWGDKFDAARCNTSESGFRKTTVVNRYPADSQSPFGVCDMAGNVWEWTSSPWGETDSDPVLRGGSWLDYDDFAACAFRYSYGVVPEYRSGSVGFRCARTQI